MNAIAAQLNTDVVKPSPELSACSDIANGFRHLALHRRSYVTGTNQGHAEVVSHSVAIGVPLIHAVVSEATMALIRGDGSIEADPVGAEEPSPPVAAPAASTSGGYTQDTFEIDIKGQHHDARDIATKAVAAWDQWLQGSSPIAAKLR